MHAYGMYFVYGTSQARHRQRTDIHAHVCLHGIDPKAGSILNQVVRHRMHTRDWSAEHASHAKEAVWETRHTPGPPALAW